MHRTLAGSLLALILLTGCGDDGDDGRADSGGSGGSRPDREVSACGELTDADVERFTGIAVTHDEVEQPLGGSVCTFVGDGSPVVTVLAAAGDEDLEELVEAGRIGPAEETTTEDVTVPGTEAAVLVTDTSYDVTTSSLVATTGSVGYTVFASAASTEAEGRLAVAALTVLLGGETDLPAPAEVVHPCDQLTADEVAGVLGARVTTDRDSAEDGGIDRCSYDGRDGTDVSVFAVDRSTSVDSVVSTQRGRFDVEELDVDGLEAAYLLTPPAADEPVQVYAAGPGGGVSLLVDAEDQERATALARELVALLAD